MKKNILLVLFMGIFIVSCKKPERPLNEAETLIKSIRMTLPSHCDLSIYSNCWNNYKKPNYSYYVPADKKEYLKSYFLIRGYKVQIKGSYLEFDFKNEYSKYLEHQKIPISLELGFLIGFFLMFLSLIYSFIRKNRKRREKIIKALENSKDLLFTGNNEDVLKKALAIKELPDYWIFKFNDEETEITGITYYNGKQFGAITYSKSGIMQNLNMLFPKKNKDLK